MRFRLCPTLAQHVLLLEACGHARYVWNLGLEQRLRWRRDKGPTPGFDAQSAQLTEARKSKPWLAAGSQTVQQQALRDLDQAWRNFFAGAHGRPTWRKVGQHEGIRIVGPQALRVRQDSRARSSVLVPKIGWVSFKRSRARPGWKSYRVSRDRSGRWHLAFAAIPEPIPAPGCRRAICVLTRPLRFDPCRARASLRCNLSDRSASLGLGPAGPAVFRRSILLTRRKPATPASTSHPIAATAKRSSSAWLAGTGQTPT